MEALHLTAKEHKVYVSGKLATEDKAGNIQARTLEYVPLQDLPDALWYHSIDVRIQVKHPPEVEVVELAIENDLPTVQRDEVVEKWFREMGVE